MHSCSQHCAAAARFTSPWPGSIIPLSNTYSTGSVFKALVTVDVLKQTVSALYCMHGTSPLKSLYLHPCANKQQVTCSLLLFQRYVPKFQGNIQIPPSMQKGADTYILHNKYHSPEHHNLNIHHCEKLKSRKNVYGNSIVTSSYL